MFFNLKPKKCKKCGAEFKPKTDWHRFCSPLCRSKEANRKRAILARAGRRALEAQEREQVAR